MLFLAAGTACSQTSPPANPLAFHLGPLQLRPSAFMESIAMFRTATTADTINTRFGSIPLEPTPGQGLISFEHSRLMLNGEMRTGGGTITGYAESDFLNPPGRQRYRWRQYWGQFEIDGWQVLGGQAWSLLRPNRSGIQTESGLMSTHVVDPAYHPGLIGRRKRQIRVVRQLGASRAAFTYDQDHDFSGKVAHDWKKTHVELAVLAGEERRRAVSLAGVVPLGGKVDWVSQQFWSQGVGPEALGVLPGGVHGHTTIQGLEARVRPSLEIFGYAGIAYGTRSAGNRAVRQWTLGFLQRLFNRPGVGAASVSGQYSQLDRSTWTGQRGGMNYVMLSVRYYYPGLR
ncbi:MAG: hypothetical protein HY013_01965 [Candidatus Solibacter usitatus]|nr:hypothetical protein [Candidatus Solibacter usitatus]